MFGPYCEVTSNNGFLYKGYSESVAFSIYLLAIEGGSARMTVDGFLWHTNEKES
jgi:hypothetical protein